MTEPRTIEFFIPWEVKPKQSFRAGSGHGFPDLKVKANAGILATFAVQHKPATPFAGPVQLDVIVRYPWRKTEKTKNRALGELPKDTRPDWDNLGKQVCDVLEGAGFFANDAQIADARIRKAWGDRASGVQIRIREMLSGKQGEQNERH